MNLDEFDKMYDKMLRWDRRRLRNTLVGAAMVLGGWGVLMGILAWRMFE